MTTNVFHSLPAQIEAIQWTGDNFEDIAIFKRGCTPIYPGENNTLTIETLEGRMTASVGDWIIRGMRGEYYPCKPDVFANRWAPGALAQLSPDAQAAACADAFRPLGDVAAKVLGEMRGDAGEVRGLREAAKAARDLLTHLFNEDLDRKTKDGVAIIQCVDDIDAALAAAPVQTTAAQDATSAELLAAGGYRLADTFYHVLHADGTVTRVAAVDQHAARAAGQRGEDFAELAEEMEGGRRKWGGRNPDAHDGSHTRTEWCKIMAAKVDQVNEGTPSDGMYRLLQVASLAMSARRALMRRFGNPSALADAAGASKGGGK